jgi:hypothetical protein
VLICRFAALIPASGSARSLRAPRMGTRDRQPDPWAMDGREFLRKKLIGKEVVVNMEYNRKIPLASAAEVALNDGQNERIISCANVELAGGWRACVRLGLGVVVGVWGGSCAALMGLAQCRLCMTLVTEGACNDVVCHSCCCSDLCTDPSPLCAHRPLTSAHPHPPGGSEEHKNVSEMVVARGFASVARHRSDEERSRVYEKLLELEELAKAAKRGMHSSKEPPPTRTNDVSIPGNAQRWAARLRWVHAGWVHAATACSAKQYMPFCQPAS